MYFHVIAQCLAYDRPHLCYFYVSKTVLVFLPSLSLFPRSASPDRLTVATRPGDHQPSEPSPKPYLPPTKDPRAPHTTPSPPRAARGLAPSSFPLAANVFPHQKGKRGNRRERREEAREARRRSCRGGAGAEREQGDAVGTELRHRPRPPAVPHGEHTLAASLALICLPVQCM